jgi:hypothetical protein
MRWWNPTQILSALSGGLISSTFFIYQVFIIKHIMGKNIIVTEEQLGSIINRLKPINESEITEGSDGNYMAKQQLFMIATLAHKMWEMMEEGEELDDWMESKIAQCDASMTSVVKAYLYDEVEEKQKGMDGLAYDDLVIGT